MNPADSIRDKLHQYIDVADEQKLQAIYVLLEDEIDRHYTKEQIDVFHQRRENHQKGLSRSWTAEESLSDVRRQKK
ncbi:MAG: hypothetical protein WDN26_22840 [Chitinophagaceae bacterium]